MHKNLQNEPTDSKHVDTQQIDLINAANPWFTVKAIDSTTFAISEYGHWEQVHSYLLLGQNAACLIDTGLGIGNIKTITDSLTDLPIKVITTHVHWDHIGGHRHYEELYVHAGDASWLEDSFPLPVAMVRRDLMRDPLTRPVPAEFNPAEYAPFRGKATTYLADGDHLELGGRTVRIVHTPGHSPGHICAYEEERGYLYTGDLLYKGTLYAFYPSTDPIAFAESIERLTKLPHIARLLPAHNELEIPVSLLHLANAGFQELRERGQLYQGSGLYDFGDVKIKI